MKDMRWTGEPHVRDASGTGSPGRVIVGFLIDLDRQQSFINWFSFLSTCWRPMNMKTPQIHNEHDIPEHLLVNRSFHISFISHRLTLE